ncbi:MAG: M20/M25/M40 family metallo-hydrolase [Candidatus Dormibacterales bacterium]
MKGGLVSMLYGAAAAQQVGLLGDGRIVFHFVCDEETGSVVSSGHLREAGLIDPDALAMVTGEPTGGVVWHANRGADQHPGHSTDGANLAPRRFLQFVHVGYCRGSAPGRRRSDRGSRSSERRRRRHRAQCTAPPCAQRERAR